MPSIVAFQLKQIFNQNLIFFVNGMFTKITDVENV